MMHNCAIRKLIVSNPVALDSDSCYISVASFSIHQLYCYRYRNVTYGGTHDEERALQQSKNVTAFAKMFGIDWVIYWAWNFTLKSELIKEI